MLTYKLNWKNGLNTHVLTAILSHRLHARAMLSPRRALDCWADDGQYFSSRKQIGDYSWRCPRMRYLCQRCCASNVYIHVLAITYVLPARLFARHPLRCDAPVSKISRQVEIIHVSPCEPGGTKHRPQHRTQSSKANYVSRWCVGCVLHPLCGRIVRVRSAACTADGCVAPAAVAAAAAAWPCCSCLSMIRDSWRPTSCGRGAGVLLRCSRG